MTTRSKRRDAGDGMSLTTLAYSREHPKTWKRLVDDIGALRVLASRGGAGSGWTRGGSRRSCVGWLTWSTLRPYGTVSIDQHSKSSPGKEQLQFIAGLCRDLIGTGLLSDRAQRADLAGTLLEFAVTLASKEVPDELWERAVTDANDRTPDERLKALVIMANPKSEDDGEAEAT